jgi:hypothetical protein
MKLDNTFYNFHTVDGILNRQCASCLGQHAIKTISITLVTRSSELLIGDALKSVEPWVDACLVVYTSTVESPWLTLTAAAEAVGEKLVAHKTPPADLAQMLNASLSKAKDLGAEWAVLIGPDEHVVDDTGMGMRQAVEGAIGSGVTQHNCYRKSFDYSQVGLLFAFVYE